MHLARLRERKHLLLKRWPADLSVLTPVRAHALSYGHLGLLKIRPSSLHWPLDLETTNVDGVAAAAAAVQYIATLLMVAR